MRFRRTSVQEMQDFTAKDTKGAKKNCCRRFAQMNADQNKQPKYANHSNFSLWIFTAEYVESAEKTSPRIAQIQWIYTDWVSGKPAALPTERRKVFATKRVW